MANSILETLYILFKGDTSDLKKSTEDVTKSTNKFTDSIKSTTAASTHLERKLVGVAKNILLTAAAFVSASAVAQGFKNALDYDVSLGNASRLLGVNSAELDAWGNAVQRTGGTAEGFQASLKGLAEHFHTTAAVALQQLPKLADVFSKVSRYSAFTYGKALGLDEPTILLLQQGRREVEAYLKHQKELGVVTEKQVEATRIYNNALVDLKHSFRSLFSELLIPSLPELESFFKTIEKGINYLKQHSDLVRGFFIGLTIVAGAAVVAIAAINLPITGMILLLTGAVALFSLLWEDLEIFGRGGISVFGKLQPYIDAFVSTLSSGLKHILENLFPVLRGFEYLKDVIAWFKGFGSNSDFKISLESGQRYLDLANSTPLNNISSNSVLNSSAFNRNLVINSMPITVHTQSTDAGGVAKEIGLHWEDQVSLTQNQFANNYNA